MNMKSDVGLGQGVTRLVVGALLLSLVVGLSVVARVAAADDADLLEQAKEIVCTYNKCLIEQSLEIFHIQRGRAPAGLEELFAAGFRRNPRCPAGGTYHLSDREEALCTLHDR